MLIKCQECGLQISDKAIFCPHCGFPLQPSKISRSSKRKKLPNGFGQITKLSNPKLRKPYRAMITVGHNRNGRPVCRILKPTGYFESYNEAYEALLANARAPFEESQNITLEELYMKWSKEAFEQISRSMVLQYELAWKYLANYRAIKFREIKAANIKAMVSQTGIPKSAGNLIKILMNKLFDYAVENDIVDKNYARITKVVKPEIDTKHHIAFSETEISALWSASNELPVQWILIQCYTGLRPDELCNLELANINLSEGYMIAGSKTKAGRNRIIPIHERILPFILNLYDSALDCGNKYLLLNYRTGARIGYKAYYSAFNAVCKAHNMDGHKPHDPRKFFITTAKRNRVDEYAIKLIVGHAINDVTEKIYTERDPKWLREEVNKIVI